MISLCMSMTPLEVHQVLCGNPCEIHKTCGECVRDFHLCAWCYMDTYSGSRCSTVSGMSASSCDPKYVENTKIFIEPVASTTETQIKPQQYNLVLRPGQRVEFNISYKEIVNYPVDLYFLIDHSGSMIDIRQDIAQKSKEIYDAMFSITKNVNLGLGSFSDKNTAPYKRIFSAQSASFKHVVSMTPDFHLFQGNLSSAPDLMNYDVPEGGFDGLAQAMVCFEEIGWRNVSRKIIIFVTEDTSHSAGDGKFAGIIQPYDGKCYTKNKIYEKELEMDYPSISILNKIATEKGVTIIFAVDDSVNKNYEKLSRDIFKGSRVVPFKKQNTTILFSSKSFSTILSDIYEEISSTIRLKTNEDIKHINLTFVPDCKTKTDVKNPECHIDRGEEKIIKGYLTVLRYHNKTSISVDIGIEGMVEEKMNLNIEIAGCSCETDVTLIEEKSGYCSGYGTKICGICKCDPTTERFGEKCECTPNSEINIDESSCRPPNSDNDTLPCSGYGRCHCGQCECLDGYDGQYCQCNKDGCPNKCSGHGECRCGTCFCHSGWERYDCSCSTAPCPSVNGKQCDGADRGSCNCGRCECKQPATWDARFEHNDACSMKQCLNCQDKQCSLLTSCAICHLNKNSVKYCLATCDFGIEVDVVETLTNVTEDGVPCENVQANIGCYTRFVYKYDEVNYKVHVVVQSKTDCNQSYFMFGGIALVTLIVFGIVTLVAWKVITEVQDRREYAKFMKAQEDASAPCQNPIFEPATTTFTNPAFNANH